jgi:hydroxymethylglutaryl-CoA synthase
MTARGILSYGAYLPYRRLDRAEIRAVAGTGGGKGTRTVASYDEDSTTLGVAAARQALAAAPAGVRPGALWFATVSPAYLDKTNATAIHAALRLPDDTAAFDAVGAVRSALGALRAGLAGPGPALVVAADIRTGRPGSPDEAEGGDAGAALLVGSDADGPLVAEVLGTASATEEFLDRWRVPGESHSRRWEERFGEGRYAALGARAWDDGLKAAGVLPEQVDRVVIAAAHGRAATTLARGLGVGDRVSPGLDATVGFTGAAHPGLLLADSLDRAAAGEVVVLVVLADGADVVVLRTTDALASSRPAVSVADQVAAGALLPYGKALAWRGYLPVEPPRRPEPARPSASAAARSASWKFGLVGTDERPLADIRGTIVTYTVDRLAYSPSPPVVFAVVDFDGGGRLPVELTDVDAADVAIGDRVEMTFRRLFTADGIHNYFWKARPVREGLREGSA